MAWAADVQCSATIYDLVQMRTDFGFRFQNIIDPLDKAKNSGCSNSIIYK